MVFERILCPGRIGIWRSSANSNSTRIVLVEGEKPENPEKNPRSRVRTNSKLNPHMSWHWLGILRGKKMATGTFTHSSQHTKTLKTLIKTFRKVIKSYNLGYTMSLAQPDKCRKNLAFFVPYRPCQVRKVLWYKVQPPSFFLRWIEPTPHWCETSAMYICCGASVASEQPHNQDLRRIYTAVSTKVVQLKCRSVRDNADWYYGQ